MTPIHLTPDELLEGIEGKMLPPEVPCRHCAVEVERCRNVVDLLREALIPPPMALATSEEVLAIALSSAPRSHGLARITTGWIALLGSCAALAYLGSHLEGYSSAVLSFLRHTPGGLGLVVASAALIAVIASPALVILGHSQLAERSIQ